MKRNILYLTGALLSSAILTLSCSEDLPTYSELTVSKTDVFIQADGQNPKETVNITSGNGNYKLDIADDNIATATVEGNSIIINGLHNGATTITVIDWTKHSAIINVKVKEDFELKTDKEEVTLFLNDEKKNTALINITSGNGSYKVESSNEQVATAELNDNNQILITALSSDFCDVILTDADGNKTTIKVGVCEDYLVLEETAGKVCVVNQTLTVGIISGNDNYSVVSENPEIATAQIVDEGVEISGISKGEANFTITDRMKQTSTFKVKVAGGFDITVTHIDTVYIIKDYDRIQTIPIIDGSGSYEINAGGSIECTLFEDKSEFIIKGIDSKMARNQKITIKDLIFDETREISVDWVDYDFYNDYGIARYYIAGEYVKITDSDFQDDSANGRVRIRVGTGRTFAIGTKGKVKNGYLVGFSNETGYEPGVKDPNNLVLAKITATGADGAVSKITELEIVKRKIEEGRGADDGQYWIKFKEEGRNEWSYIVTWL